jgi:hypothetical protein
MNGPTQDFQRVRCSMCLGVSWTGDITAIAVSSLHASDRDKYYNSLLAKAGATPAANRVEKTSRDEYYASLLASMQNQRASKPPKLAEPSADVI